MNDLINNLMQSFQYEGSDVSEILKLIPSAKKEIDRIKANGNKIGFVKDGGRWYADLPNWPLDRYHLEMVAGADDLMEELADGKSYVTIKLSQHKKHIKMKDGEALLKLIELDPGGFSGSYRVIGDFKTDEAWLCPVVNFVFMCVPAFIKFKKVN
jgi:hypothetical protein